MSDICLDFKICIRQNKSQYAKCHRIYWIFELSRDKVECNKIYTYLNCLIKMLIVVIAEMQVNQKN